MGGKGERPFDVLSAIDSALFNITVGMRHTLVNTPAGTSKESSFLMFILHWER